MNITHKDMLLYAITDRHWLNGRSLSSQVEEVLKNGATFLQLREKNLSHEEIVKEGKIIKKIAEKYHVPFVINDDIMAAKEIDADGVHIGQSDMEYKQARQILGDDKIIGMTAHNLKEALEAQEAGADYIGVGAVFHTDTKKDTTPLSQKELKEITSHVSIPVVAIGGIKSENIHELSGSGINGVAVVSALFAKEDAGMAAKHLLKLCTTYLKNNVPQYDYKKNSGNYQMHLFDMDGTLLDSMPMWKHLDEIYLGKYDIDIPDNLNDIIAPLTLPECAEYFRTLGIHKTAEEILAEIISHVEEEYRLHIPLKKGMQELVKYLHDTHKKLCLVTTSERTYVEPALKRLSLYDYFDNIYTSTELGMDKRSGDIYQKICELNEVSPQETVIYEDTLFAVRSAKEAGCHVVAVYDESSDSDWNDIAVTADEVIL